MKLKLKGRFESIPMMAVLCIFAAGLVAVLPLRTYQLMRLIEPETKYPGEPVLVSFSVCSISGISV